jgi:hypothetical protein
MLVSDELSQQLLYWSGSAGPDMTQNRNRLDFVRVWRACEEIGRRLAKNARSRGEPLTFDVPARWYICEAVQSE